MSDTMHATTYDSPLGRLDLVASAKGLVAVLWPDDPPARVRLDDELITDSTDPVLAATVEQLDEFFAGTRTSFDVPLDLRGTEFQVATWQSLAKIPYGETATYGEQAKLLGRPKAVRAIGAANGRNPVSIVLPCHRVVGADGSLTGFAGGLDAKRFLLDLEREHAPAAPGTLGF